MGARVWGDEKGDVVLNEPCVKCGQIDAYVARGCSRCGAPRNAQKVDDASAIAEDVTTMRPALQIEEVTTRQQTPPNHGQEHSGLLPPLDLTGSIASGRTSAPPPLPPLPSVSESSSLGAQPQATRMDASAESALPSASPTVILTVLFGVFGGFMAWSQTKKARASGVVTDRYWKTFWISLLISIVTSTVVYVLMVFASIALLAALVQ